MGAPGKASFCKKGHLYHWVDKGLYYDGDELGGEVECCPCGEKTVKSVCHYGDPNDCLNPKDYGLLRGDQVIERVSIDTIRIKIPDAVNANGEGIEAYHDVKFDV
ncbi:MAG: hypothetical protein A3I89_03285 [Candidatus Harrisonbacteria bacterium RIFCSPLOWO2_02_FULL_41_11]|uniref:Uncharacterized protein n=1 Tax=Candidatus Harrisonbacteria bacterium RIFCSPHIGHO2_02_FULL_42_16 TaxID=1798404 RepID=A0A1G1ZJ24_9BACT|nr:MAG: hypothetical protein A3B92_02775 [Candidatus Harrisonbacteria bacterium RIFCSPHIGHO2_02_FULL_42_16]OGY66261.1 MAG: hypothetical protein A3I89_03285 [Candidatus Harrisonbacteria bacterium RIFCSPLOWO2_02_FULL_41_11]